MWTFTREMRPYCDKTLYWMFVCVAQACPVYTRTRAGQAGMH